MNAVEIEQAITELSEQPFDAVEFPYQFLQAFGDKEATIKRLRSKKGTNKTDLDDAVLKYNNIHIAVSPQGKVSATLKKLRDSAATKRQKVKFILATDGEEFQAEELISNGQIICLYSKFPDHFGFFLSLAGIRTVQPIQDNAFDIRATSRLNKLYVELQHANPDWDTQERRNDMNHFMTKLIFCFFAEDTGIFKKNDLFTKTVREMSENNGANTHEVIGEIFRAMNITVNERKNSDLPRWAADPFPYANGGLFSDSNNTPRFTQIARSYLISIGDLNWTKINPDIFGSMMQAVADEEERGNLGMHYTSVRNILKVLNPLFLDDLRAQLEKVGSNKRALLNLRNRIAKIRVFDPACGSGNFLVIAYKEMRKIEVEINKRRKESKIETVIPLTNFRGIELRNFSAEIARLALIIAEYQCDVTYRGQVLALAEFLPLSTKNWITCGNALRLDWLSICPPTGESVKLRSDDLLNAPTEESAIDFANEGGETYICGNPPYLGSTWQSPEQKSDLKEIFKQHTTKSCGALDYVAGWFMKAADYGTHTQCTSAFVSTNSICQGVQVPMLWPLIFATGHEILFAHTSFKWANLASHNAGVTVAIVGISAQVGAVRTLFSANGKDETLRKDTDNINAYLIAGPNIEVAQCSLPTSEINEMLFGNKPTDGGNLLLGTEEQSTLLSAAPEAQKFIRRFLGAQELIRGQQRYCLWIEDEDLDEALSILPIKERIEKVRVMRLASHDKGANKMATRSHQMREMNIATESMIVVPRVSSENRDYLPVDYLTSEFIIGDRNFALYDAPLWNMALIASRLHWVWIGTVCARMRTDFSYSNTLGWNTFPIPQLTANNKTDLTRCAEEILLAREAYFPATIADLYVPTKMPKDLQHAHEMNDEVLERIYMGRRFKNDTERLEKLFKLYANSRASSTQTDNNQTTSKKARKHK